MSDALDNLRKPKNELVKVKSLKILFCKAFEACTLRSARKIFPFWYSPALIEQSQRRASTFKRF